jgi:hypothetical protein
MKSKKSKSKYVNGGTLPSLSEIQVPSFLPPKQMAPLGFPNYYLGSDVEPTSPIKSVSQSQIDAQVAKIEKAGGALKGAASAGLAVTGLGFLAPVATAAIGLGQSAAAKRAASRLREPVIETPQAVMQRFQQLSDRTLMDRKLEEYNRALGTGVEAIQMGSGREIGALPALIRAQQQGVSQAVAEQQAREEAGTGILAQSQLQQQAMEQRRFEQERAGLQSQYEAGLQGTMASLGQLGAAAIRAKYAGYRQAEKGMKTPGAFSHESNPLAIVAKNGAMVGEMTGSEVILNPKQTQKIAKQSEYMRNLLKKPRFKNG